MKAIIFAVLTAVCWSVGGFFEKKGLHSGNLEPVMGITIRTAVALVILGAASFPCWSSVAHAGLKPLAFLILGGGVVAGSAGMLCFYTAIKTGQVSKVIPIAFGLSPAVGYFLGVFLLKEPFTFLRFMGVLLVSIGVVIITFK